MSGRRCVARLRGLLGPVLAAATAQGCTQPECATLDYRSAECRVVAENEHARLRLPGGAELRFQDPDVGEAASWDARGLLEILDGGIVRARVAGPGRFALSLAPGPGGPSRITVILDNVDPAALVTVGPPGAEIAVPASDSPGLQREIDVDLTGPETLWIRGSRACPATHRLAVTADIQTNPLQFERIVERLQVEAERSDEAGEPLVGLVILGDLTEASRDDEFLRIAAIQRSSPVPVAVTPGNHDVYRILQPHYNARFGPGNHVVDVCDTRFVLLDSGSGSIARSVEGRLPELLDRGGAQHLLVGMHHPPYSGRTGSGWSLEDRAAHLLVESAIAGVDLVLAGHNHALRHFDGIAVGDVELEQIVVGTGGAFQGLGAPRYGFLRLTLGPAGVDPCFVEVPPPGVAQSQNDPLSSRLPHCE
jgi:hypothetical protein